MADNIINNTYSQDNIMDNQDNNNSLLLVNYPNNQ